MSLSPSDWPCDRDVVSDEEIEILDSYTQALYSAKVVDVIDGIISVSIDAFMNQVSSIDPAHTKWRRLGSRVKYGVTCTDKYCNEFYPDQVYSDNFVCYRCRHR